ncbi:unnamed protein product [Amoebophrya sp. A120]|nr:unnamed protein product [Amoebophrya sp. A120]|eukprot:GSA120T00007736001.1
MNLINKELAAVQNATQTDKLREILGPRGARLIATYVPRQRRSGHGRKKHNIRATISQEAVCRETYRERTRGALAIGKVLNAPWLATARAAVAACYHNGKLSKNKIDAAKVARPVAVRRATCRSTSK